jgi:hypothetical protein
MEAVRQNDKVTTHSGSQRPAIINALNHAAIALRNYHNESIYVPQQDEF